jgi:hypothetical protein
MVAWGAGAAGPVDARFVHIWTITDGLVSRYEQLAGTRDFCDAVRQMTGNAPSNGRAPCVRVVALRPMRGCT